VSHGAWSFPGASHPAFPQAVLQRKNLPQQGMKLRRFTAIGGDRKGGAESDKKKVALAFSFSVSYLFETNRLTTIFLATLAA
jgi:hypothetical protein